MSTTTPRALKAGADVRLRGVYESYVQALGDLDKASGVEDAAYYQGEVDAYLDVLDTFGELEPEEVPDWRPANDSVLRTVEALDASSAPETENVAERLEYLRSQIQAECISYGEIAELQGLADQIEPGDVELLEWAGVPEGGWVDCPQCTYRAIDTDDLAEHIRLNPATHPTVREV